MRGGLALTSAAVVAAALAAGGCSAKNDNANEIAGKKLFVQKCGSCHVLARAGTKGTVGPNLDEAFHQSKSEGFGRSAIQGVVHKQILFPSRPAGAQTGVMPAALATGQDAIDIAAYVASSVAVGGKDTGLLATAVPTGSKKPAVAKNGVLEIPADPTGQLLFANTTATAPAGKLTIKMPNMSGVPHNIAIAGKGQGEIVEKGDSEFSADFTPGKYTYICEVQGHEAAGMKGTLTVK